MPTLTNYHWDVVDDCVMTETDQNGSTIVTYTHEPGHFGPLISENRDIGWTGLTVNDWSALSVEDWGSLSVSNPTEYCHHYDTLGSTTMLTDETGAVTDTFQYDAWGNVVARTGLTPSPYQWVGRLGYQFDVLTSGHYIRARSYQPAIARFVALDPLVQNAGSDLFETLYCYASNSPGFVVDPSGLLSIGLDNNLSETGKCGQPNAFFWNFGLGMSPEMHNCDKSIDRKGDKDKKKSAYTVFGYFVQEVQIWCNIDKKCGCNCPTIPTALGKPDLIIYESWEVTKKGKSPYIQEANILNYSDRFGWTAMDKTCGYRVVKGTVKFFCVDDTGDLGEWDVANATGSWSARAKWASGCATLDPGGLPSTNNSEDVAGFWGSKAKEGPLDHKLECVWNCCGQNECSCLPG